MALHENILKHDILPQQRHSRLDKSVPPTFCLDILIGTAGHCISLSQSGIDPPSLMLFFVPLNLHPFSQHLRVLAVSRLRTLTSNLCFHSSTLAHTILYEPPPCLINQDSQHGMNRHLKPVASTMPLLQSIMVFVKDGIKVLTAFEVFLFSCKNKKQTFKNKKQTFGVLQVKCYLYDLSSTSPVF